jgi:hypothetical protein
LNGCELKGTSIAGVFFIVIVVGFILTSTMWLVNLCACCKCCRNNLRCCFGVFEGHPLKGRLTILALFLTTAVVATSAYAGRNEFNAAVFEAGDQIRALGDSFVALENSAIKLEFEASAISTATAASACDDGGTGNALTSASLGLTSAAEGLAKLLDGVGDLLYDAADLLEASMAMTLLFFISMTD